MFWKSIIIAMCEENRAAMSWNWSQGDCKLGTSPLQLFHCIRAISFTSLGEAFTFLWDPCCTASCPATETDTAWAVSLNPLCSQLHSNAGNRKLQEYLECLPGVWGQENYSFLYRYSWCHCVPHFLIDQNPVEHHVLHQQTLDRQCGRDNLLRK